MLGGADEFPDHDRARRTPGADINALYGKARADRLAAGYDESDYREVSNGLRINCKIVIVPKERTILVALEAPVVLPHASLRPHLRM